MLLSLFHSNKVCLDPHRPVPETVWLTYTVGQAGHSLVQHLVSSSWEFVLSICF